MAKGLSRIGLVLAVVSVQAFAPADAPAQPRVPIFQPSLRQTDSDGYRARLETLRGLVSACRDDAKTCNAVAIGDDDKIASANESFQVRWQWLRKLLNDAHDPALPNRSALLNQATARLDEELAAAGGQEQKQAAFATARRTTNSILARAEFRVVGRQSWLDRKIARLLSWFYEIFTAASDFGHRAPWLGPVLEWGFVGLSAVFVLFWVRRSMERERLAISLSGQLMGAEWQKESAQWAELARAEAAQDNWREAIHCLYWASIVVLESRRLWRRDAARTPREYVELLARDSAEQNKLRRLTRIFERIWYGLRTAAREDYTQALTLFEELRQAG
jgi:hypothetical protein